IVFADPLARARLESITHPRIQALAEQRLADLAAKGHKAALYEASLLVESGRYRHFEGLIVVTASPETQLERALARGGPTEERPPRRERRQARGDVERNAPGTRRERRAYQRRRPTREQQRRERRRAHDRARNERAAAKILAELGIDRFQLDGQIRRGEKRAER